MSDRVKQQFPRIMFIQENDRTILSTEPMNWAERGFSKLIEYWAYAEVRDSFDRLERVNEQLNKRITALVAKIETLEAKEEEE